MIRGRWKVRFVGACLLAALGGCGAVQDWRNEVDPIRGGTPIPTGSAAATRPVAPGDAPPPPLLTGSPSTSPTALTVGASAPARVVPAAPAVSIQMPRPAGQAPAVPGVIVPASATVPAPAGGTTFEQVQQALKARGVTEQHLDTTGKPDEWSFTCAVPFPNDPLRRSNYDTTMVGANGLEAMIAVLHKIEQDQKNP